LIDRSAEGLIDKDEFEPRMTRLRQRLARLEEQRQAGADEAALQTELPRIIGRLEDFATKVHSGLEAADWTSKRDLIRALVKRVEVARDDVNIVFRIDPYPDDADLEKKSLQLCRGSDNSPLWCSGKGVFLFPLFHHTGALITARATLAPAGLPLGSPWWTERRWR
jgi:site-specific DNA recombinase